MASSWGPGSNGQAAWFDYSVSWNATSAWVDVKGYLYIENNRSVSGTWAQSWWGHWGEGSANVAINKPLAGEAHILIKSAAYSVGLGDSPGELGYGITGRSYWGAVTHVAYVWIPAKSPSAPNPPSITRNSDTQHTLNWGNVGTYTSVRIHRRTNEGAWTQIANPGGNVTSYVDTTTQANRYYEYRIIGVNSRGDSPPSAVRSVYTTPAPPVGVKAEKVGSDIRVSVAGLSPYGESYDIFDGATLVADNVQLPWTHISPNASITHTYTIKGNRGSLQSAASAPSNTVQLLATPNAPTLISPASGSTVAVATTRRATWQHNPVDTTAQEAFNFRYRQVGTTIWTTVTGTTASFVDIPSTTARSVEWQVQTKGQYETFSPWSSVATFTTVNLPGAVILTPPNGVDHLVPGLTVSWSYSQAQGRPQTRYELELRDGSTDELIESLTGADTATSVTVATQLANGRSYTVRLRVATGDIWSGWVTSTFDVAFVRPATPEVSGEWDEAEGHHSITARAARGPVVADITNHFPNPSFDQVPVTGVTRTNFVRNSSGVAGPGQVTASGAGYVRVTSDVFDGMQCLRVDSDSFDPATDAQVTFNLDTIPTANRGTILVSLWVNLSELWIAPGLASGHITGMLGTNAVNFDPIDPMRGWQKLTARLVNPAGAINTLRIDLDPATEVAILSKLYISEVFVGNGEPFTGTTIPQGFGSYEWVGTPHLSALQEKMPPLVVLAENTFQNSSLSETLPDTAPVYTNLYANAGAAETVQSQTLLNGRPGALAGTSGSFAVTVPADWSVSGKAAQLSWSTVQSGDIGWLDLFTRMTSLLPGRYIFTFAVKLEAGRAKLQKTLTLTNAPEVNASVLSVTSRGDGVLEYVARLVVKATPASATSRLSLGVLDPVAGGTVEVSMFDLYTVPEGQDADPSRRWFSGDYSPGAGDQVAWQGDPHRSPSILYRRAVRGVVGGIQGTAGDGTTVLQVREDAPAPRLEASGVSTFSAIAAAPGQMLGGIVAGSELTNHFPDPRCRYNSPYAVRRRNLASQPRGLGNTWTAPASTSPSYGVTLATPLGGVTTGVISTASADTVGSEQFISSAAASKNLVSAGTTVSLSIFARSNRTKPLSMRVAWLDASGAVVGTVSYNYAKTAPAGVGIRLESPGLVVPAGAVRVSLGAGSLAANTLAGDVLEVTGAMIEVAPKVGDYFDGYSTHPYWTAMWEGPDSNANSILVGADLVEVARNLAAYPVPQAVSNWSIGGGVGGTYTDAIWSDSRFAGDKARARRWLTADTSGDTYLMPNSTAVTVADQAVGDTYFVSMRLALAGAGISAPGWGNALLAGAPTVSVTQLPTISHSEGSYTYRALLRITAVGTAELRPLLRGFGTVAAGSEIAAGEFVFAKSTVAVDFFSGEFSRDTDLVPYWLGVSHTSPSVLIGRRASALSQVGCFAILSTKFGGSVRLIPNSDSNNSYAWLPTPVAARGARTLLGTVSLLEPQTGTLNSNARGMYTANPASGKTATNVVGSQEVRHEAPALTDNYTLRFYNGAALGGGDVYWSGLGVFLGSYAGDVFSGGDSFTGGRASTWLGEANNSASQSYLTEVSTAARVGEMLQVVGENSAVFSPGQWAGLSIVSGAAVDHRFTGIAFGQVPADEDFSIHSSLTGNAQLVGRSISGVVSTSSAFAILSTKWAAEGQHSARVIPRLAASSETFVTATIPAAVRASGTLVARRYIPAEITGTLSAIAGKLAGREPFTLADGALTVGEETVRVKVEGIVTPFEARLCHGGRLNSGDMFWDLLTMVDGHFDVSPFSGDTGELWAGESVLRPTWLGVEHNSPSIARSVPETVTMNLESSIDGGLTWRVVAHDVPVLGESLVGMVDWEGLSCGTTLYRVTSVTAAGATAVREIPVAAASPATWLSGGQMFDQVARLDIKNTRSITRGRARSTIRYEGRALPVGYASSQKSQALTLTGSVLDHYDEGADRERLYAVVEALHPVHLYRDPHGTHLYGVIGTVATNEVAKLTEKCVEHECASSVWSYSIGLEETGRD